MSQSTRKLKRIQLVCYLDVLAAEDDSRVGQLVDITEEGLGVRAVVAYTVGEHYRLKVVLPTTIQGLSAFEVEGRCAWLGDADIPGLALMGFEFTDITPDVVEVIGELIRRYGR